MLYEIQIFLSSITSALTSAASRLVTLVGPVPICVCCPWVTAIWLAFAAPGMTQAMPAWTATTVSESSQAAQDTAGPGTARLEIATTAYVRENIELTLEKVDPMSGVPRAAVTAIKQRAAIAGTTASDTLAAGGVRVDTRPGSTVVEVSEHGPVVGSVDQRRDASIGAPELP